MRMKMLSIFAMAFFVASGIQVSSAAPQENPCSIPPDLQREIATTHPGARIVSAIDLDRDDRKFFEADHGNSCPGAVKVDFYGDGKPTLALVLIVKDGTKQQTELIVAHLLDDRWKIGHLDTGGPGQYAPVVWSQPSGTYRDVHGKKTIRTTRPVIVFCKYEAWSILYAWTEKGLSKIWIAD
jgi:hypothetical protein